MFLKCPWFKHRNDIFSRKRKYINTVFYFSISFLNKSRKSITSSNGSVNKHEQILDSKSILKKERRKQHNKYPINWTENRKEMRGLSSRRILEMNLPELSFYWNGIGKKGQRKKKEYELLLPRKWFKVCFITRKGFLRFATAAEPGSQNWGVPFRHPKSPLFIWYCIT